MIVGVLKETFPGERRVALVPAEITRFTKRKLEVLIESGAGEAAGHLDAEYTAKGASIVPRQDIFAKAEIILGVRFAGASDTASANDAARPGQVIIGFMDPLGKPVGMQALTTQGATTLALELIPRITRAQSMDALSSMATIAGHHAVLLAASNLPKLFPMLMTAAGTLTPSKVFVLGVGVAGLQAIATAKRLGGVVEAYDVRPEVKEQVQSVGGKFVELAIETSNAGDAGGYAKQQSAGFYARQQELLAGHLRDADVIITTAAIPGKKAPILVTESMMKGMRPGSVVIDLASETGGNVEGTVAGQKIVRNDVMIIGPTNIASEHPAAASQMLARNLSNLVTLITTKEGQLELNRDDDVIKGCLVSFGGSIVHERVVGGAA